MIALTAQSARLAAAASHILPALAPSCHELTLRMRRAEMKRFVHTSLSCQPPISRPSAGGW